MVNTSPRGTDTWKLCTPYHVFTSLILSSRCHTLQTNERCRHGGIEIWVNCLVCDLLNQSRLWMVHQMWEALFVTTFQNKDNLLIYTKTICKKSYKMQKNIISFFCTIIFLQTRKNSHTTQLFYLSIYLFVLQLTLQKVIYSAYRKKVLSIFLP